MYIQKYVYINCSWFHILHQHDIKTPVNVTLSLDDSLKGNGFFLLLIIVGFLFFPYLQFNFLFFFFFFFAWFNYMYTEKNQFTKHHCKEVKKYCHKKNKNTGISIQLKSINLMISTIISCNAANIDISFKETYKNV